MPDFRKISHHFFAFVDIVLALSLKLLKTDSSRNLRDVFKKYFNVSSLLLELVFILRLNKKKCWKSETMIGAIQQTTGYVWRKRSFTALFKLQLFWCDSTKILKEPNFAHFYAIILNIRYATTIQNRRKKSLYLYSYSLKRENHVTSCHCFASVRTNK